MLGWQRRSQECTEIESAARDVVVGSTCRKVRKIKESGLGMSGWRGEVVKWRSKG